MKTPIFCLFILFSSPVFSQALPKNTLDSILKHYTIDSVKLRNLPLRPNSIPAAWTRIDSNYLGTIYALPLDNMSCIVPDMKNHRSMPNTGNSSMLKKPVDPGIYSYRERTYTHVIPFTPRKPLLIQKTK